MTVYNVKLNIERHFPFSSSARHLSCCGCVKCSSEVLNENENNELPHLNLSTTRMKLAAENSYSQLTVTEFSRTRFQISRHQFVCMSIRQRSLVSRKSLPKSKNVTCRGYINQFLCAIFLGHLIAMTILCLCALHYRGCNACLYIFFKWCISGFRSD